MAHIDFSLGKSKFDNCPEQLGAESFDDFIQNITSNRSQEKGRKYFCSALLSGVHYERPKKYAGIDHWRLAKYRRPRVFFAFDFDGFDSAATFEALKAFFTRWNGLLYTTASHTAENPRARAVVELSREIEPTEGATLGEAIQMMIDDAVGPNRIKYDKSVYQATQPVYTPLVDAETWRHSGPPLNVDSIMAQALSATPFSDLPSGPSKLMVGLGFGQPNSPDHIPEGQRNQSVLKYVGRLRKKAVDEDEIEVLALDFNRNRCHPPLDEREVLSIVSRYSNDRRSRQSHGATDSWSADRGRPRLSNTPPPAREYVLADQVTPGTLTVIGGQGGVAKTMFMLQTCVAAAVGKNLGRLKVSPGASLLFLGEEDTAERDRRISAICLHSQADLKTVEKRVRCYASAGIDIRLTQKIDANAQETYFGDQVIKLAQEHQQQAGVPIKLIVFDHARLVLGGDPNNAEDVTQLTRVLTNVARHTKAAVFLLAHSPKSVSGKSGSEINAADIAGSSAFVDHARAAYMMWTMREDDAKLYHIPLHERSDYVRLENVKCNYGRTGGGYWFHKEFLREWEVAVLNEKPLYSQSLYQSKGTTALRDRLLTEIRRRRGGTTERNLRDISGKDGVLKASDKAVRAEITKMVEDGLVDRRPPTTRERGEFRLAATVREVLVPMN